MPIVEAADLNGNLPIHYLLDHVPDFLFVVHLFFVFFVFFVFYVFFVQASSFSTSSPICLKII
jgi:hypothetical protein